MHRFHLIKKKILPALTGLLVASGAMAQQTSATTDKTVSSSYNQLQSLLIIIMILLVFVIWGLGQALLVLGRQVIEKNKNTGKAVTVLLVIGFLSSSQTSFAQVTATTETIKELPNYGGLSSTTFYLFVSVLAIEVIAILFLAFLIRGMYKELLPQKVKTVVARSRFKEWWTKFDAKFFTKAVSVEKEADILLDHDYDGIRELDNALPPWWKYGFYITIAFAFIYLLNFHVLGLGKNPTEEYNSEMENARIEKEIFEANNKDKIDENNVPIADAAGLAKAKEIFSIKCWACHGKLGEGGAGPNLTDNYWLHKGSLNDIYHTIKNGYPDKGMQSWATEYTPKEISYLANYVKTLHGTNPPNPKAQQGELYVEVTNAPPVGASSKVASANTSTSKKKIAIDSAKAKTATTK